MRRFCLCPTSGMRDMGRVVLLILVGLCQAISASPEDRSISAVIGGDVTLPCRAEGYMPFKVVEWSRPGANLEYVLILRNKNLDPKIPKPGYKGRVELKDLQNGDVSLVLRNVTSEDSGTYECYVLKSTVRRKRAIKPISTITLNVLPLGSNHESQDDGGNKDGSDGLTGDLH
ncbi:PREDICTED: hyaluronan and proteoglycan link protein 4-like [Cyprinodon variegatus]|uniref:hyaluronan and proteoglycan link protein 4-like n=1 Tax=Cyprinodon variegatus TaxID=28743 RepID=UPI000742919A|nr:PREDICTED: hyaluronan and proteoglycan link protein 4-like [Cyprinodon variegatus]